MSLHFLAISLSILLLVYHQVTTWFPLFPWNDVEKYSRKELTLEAGTNGVLMGTGIVCLTFGNTGFFHYYPLIYYPFLFAGELFQWWLPYFCREVADSKWAFDYEAHFSRTFKLIPHKNGKRTPDANHTVLHCLTVLTLIVVYLERLTIE